ncbi:hypothetical protein H4W79_005093 [Nocardiopsis terrae]|uniref:Uncharacterized protein n=1 Tax=Nocardiopsis terrae TaxID=372655 RepID=A0ABR9HPD5_9ACTN|nr:hypothetical protein [Nocardiopsis terrae]
MAGSTVPESSPGPVFRVVGRVLSLRPAMNRAARDDRDEVLEE